MFEWREKKSIKNFNFTMTIMVLLSRESDCDFNVSFSVGRAFMKLHRNDDTDDDEKKLFLLLARTFFIVSFCLHKHSL